MKKFFYFGVFLLMTSCNTMSQSNKKEPEMDVTQLLGYDYRLFENTLAWDLAKAVRDEKIEEIKRIAESKKNILDFQEPRFGNTLLMLAVFNQNYNSAKALLELGADPNKHDNYDGTSPMILSAGIQNRGEDNTKFLKLMLAHGGNPNDEEVGVRRKDNSTRKTPLLVACSDNLTEVEPMAKVKLLVEAGADITHKNEFDWTALKEANVGDHFDVMLYFLERGADYTSPFYIHPDGKKMYLVDLMRYDEFPLDSKKYADKMKVVEFLKQKGINYRSLPIPEEVVRHAKQNYPQNWKEYLDKY